MKIYVVLLLTALLLACKPAVQATVQSNMTSPATSISTASESEQTPLASSNHEMPKGIRSSYLDCIKKDDALEIGYCINEERKYQDKRLNDYYKSLLSVLTPKQKQALIESQRAWLSLHEHEEAFEVELYGSDQVSNLQVGEGGVLRLCNRANQLQDYFHFVID